MKAVIYTKYGAPDVLRFADVPKPTPAADEILVKIHATTVTAGDWRMRKAEPYLARLYNGLLRPRKINILGFEYAGDVEAVGADVTRFQPGDAVFAYAGLTFGGYAEYRTFPEAGSKARGWAAHKPANLTYEEAAAIPVGASTALDFLRRANIRRGERVLINGASGSVGTYAVQLAKHYGAHVTGVCSTANVDLVRAIGADHVIDYTREDFTNSGDAEYDVVFDAVGQIMSGVAPRHAKRVLRPGGMFLTVDSDSHFQPDDLTELAEMAEARIIRPVIDRCYPLAEIAEAHRYVQTRRKRGNVAVLVNGHH